MTQPTRGDFADLPQIAQFATEGLSIGRRHLALTQLTDTIKNRGGDGVFCSVVREGERMLAAGVATRIASDAAMLVGCGQLGSLADEGRLLAMLSHLHQQIAAAGIKFIQATWDINSERPPFAVAAYENIAQLDYLSVAVPCDSPASPSVGVQRSSTPASPSDDLTLCEIDPRQAGQRQRMTAIVEKTFEATQDCPALNRFRSPQDIVHAYLDSPAFDPTGWRILQHQQTDVACLITTPYLSAATLELTYMGVAARTRGRGWGQRLLDEAFRIARRGDLTDVMLAVDQRNQPALNVYQRAGFRTVASEAVWGRFSVL